MSGAAVAANGWQNATTERMKRWGRAVLPSPVYQAVAPRVKEFLRRRHRRVSPLSAELKRRDPRFGFFKHAASYVSVNRIHGVYAEFGSCGAQTIRYALHTLGDPIGMATPVPRFYAFDSFEGLPEPQGIDRQRNLTKGRFAMTQEQFRRAVRKDLDRIDIVAGYYEDRLPGLSWPAGQEIAMAYVDCDLYSSTQTALRFLADKMAHGGIVAFDDWNMYYGDPQRGQRRAFAEFQASIATQAHFEPYLPIPYLGMSFIYLKRPLMGQAVE